MKSTFLITFLALGTSLFAGCSDSQPSRTYTVDELMADEPLLQKLFAECQKNPGLIGNTPNCVNAFQANHHMNIRKARENLKN
ncbi:hypothetical protein EDF68_11415 [Ochrobactrum sp. BH3]|nr:hypothetical protein EDF68_11415 [Ochrobactrum sp. BH3]